MQLRPSVLPFNQPPKLLQQPALRAFPLAGPELAKLGQPAPVRTDARLRAKVGEAVGAAFYAHLITEMQKTTFETPLMHGGRGEEVFKGQLTQELARKMGTAPGNALTERLYRAVAKRAPAAREAAA
jgi:hypothetical protein